jgi:hypothetical protein
MRNFLGVLFFVIGRKLQGLGLTMLTSNETLNSILTTIVGPKNTMRVNILDKVMEDDHGFNAS